MPNPTIGRILKKAGEVELWEALAEKLSPTDLSSLLLEAFRIRAGRLAPSEVLDRYQRGRFAPPARVDPRIQSEFDLAAYSLLPAGFEPLELSPVCPLGTVSALAPVNQNNVLTTIRGVEVTADSTNVLALECALRRRAAMRKDPRSASAVRLCSSHRLLRTQTFDIPVAFPHFRIFSLCTAGRDRGSFRFERESLAEQAGFYIRLLDRSRSFGLKIRDTRLVLFLLEPDLETRLTREVGRVLGESPSAVTPEIAPPPEDAPGYYRTVRFQISARDPQGRELLLVDGGFTDWTQRLLGSRKERLLISGLGSERLLAAFRG